MHLRVGYDCRILEIQSAVGLKELERIDTWNLPRRRRDGEIAMNELKDCEQALYLPVHTQEKVNVFYVFPIVLNLEKLIVDKKTILEALAAEGLPV